MPSYRIMQKSRETKTEQARSVLKDLGMPVGQQNVRSALCFLALLGLSPEKEWNEATNPLLGITPIMNWITLPAQDGSSKDQWILQLTGHRSLLICCGKYHSLL